MLPSHLTEDNKKGCFEIQKYCFSILNVETTKKTQESLTASACPQTHKLYFSRRKRKKWNKAQENSCSEIDGSEISHCRWSWDGHHNHSPDHFHHLTQMSPVPAETAAGMGLGAKMRHILGHLFWSHVWERLTKSRWQRHHTQAAKCTLKSDTNWRKNQRCVPSWRSLIFQGICFFMLVFRVHALRNSASPKKGIYPWCPPRKLMQKTFHLVGVLWQGGKKNHQMQVRAVFSWPPTLSDFSCSMQDSSAQAQLHEITDKTFEGLRISFKAAVS